jgi:ketosteroid isomerase-like protein
MRSTFESAMARHDVEAACATYTEDARLLPPALGAVRGRSKICDFWKAGLDFGMSVVVFEPEELKETGDGAFELGRYRIEITSSDQPAVVEVGPYIRVYERNGGGWQIAVEMFSPGGRK